MMEYRHPVKARFPGMPSHAKTFRKQEYAFDPEMGALDLREELRFEGIPKADCFTGLAGAGELCAREVWRVCVAAGIA